MNITPKHLRKDVLAIRNILHLYADKWRAEQNVIEREILVCEKRAHELPDDRQQELKEAKEYREALLAHWNAHIRTCEHLRTEFNKLTRL